MAFVIKTRGAGGLLAADYRCPQCGLVERIVQRDENGDPPEVIDCGNLLDCGERIAREFGEVRCDQKAVWTISAPMTRVKLGEVSRGKPEEPPSPGHLDTRALADGMPFNEWRDKRHKALREKAVKKLKEKIG